jgi:tetratricopeptide (TPR) repeat protein
VNKVRYGGGLLAQARAELALGNVGLALETFRKIQREQPESADLFAGIAACYAAMGRYDLARANYEFALAYSPDNAALLTALASSLERLGEIEQAAQVRAEAWRLSSAPAVNRSAEQVAFTPDGVPRASIIAALPPASPVRTASSQAAAKASPLQSSATVSDASPALPHAPTPEQKIEAAVAKPPRPSVTRTATPEPPLPSTRSAPEVAQVRADIRPGPYLERKSLGEVSLITTARPVQLAQLNRIAAQPGPATRSGLASDEHPKRPELPSSQQLAATAPRWVPLRLTSAPQEIQLLNAARSQGLAARTRSALLDRGWRKIGIGNARTVRQRSLVLYAPARASVARKLAAQFRCKTMKAAGIRNVVVLLGRDSVARRSSPSRA